MIDAENDNDIYNDKDTGNNTDNRELQKTMTATATSLNKRFNEQNYGCTRRLEIFVNKQPK